MCLVFADMTFTVTSAIAAPLSGDKHDYQSMGYYWWPCNEAIKVCNKVRVVFVVLGLIV